MCGSNKVERRKEGTTKFDYLSEYIQYFSKINDNVKS